MSSPQPPASWQSTPVQLAASQREAAAIAAAAEAVPEFATNPTAAPGAPAVTADATAVSNVGNVVAAQSSPNTAINAGLASYAPISLPSIGVRIREFVGGWAGGNYANSPKFY